MKNQPWERYLYLRQYHPGQGDPDRPGMFVEGWIVEIHPYIWRDAGGVIQHTITPTDLAVRWVLWKTTSPIWEPLRGFLDSQLNRRLVALTSVLNKRPDIIPEGAVPDVYQYLETDARDVGFMRATDVVKHSAKSGMTFRKGAKPAFWVQVEERT